MMKRQMLGVALVTLLTVLLLATPVRASLGIESFTTTISTTEAGAHPDLTTSFALDTSASESARDVIFNLPEGMFGNINALTRCSSADFALDQCPSNAQAGLITVRGGFGGDPDHLFGTAPIFYVEPGGEEAARLSFIVPELELPIAIPIAVRTGDDFGLRFTVAGITQLFPLSKADLTVWGIPALSSHDAERFPKGSPGNPAGCPGLADASCNLTPTRASIAANPLTINPSLCSGQPLVTELDVRTYQDPDQLSHATSTYPPTTECVRQTFNPVVQASPTTDEVDAPSGFDLDLVTPQALGFTASSSSLRTSIVTLPEGFTVNPDAADGQSACRDADANFGTELAANCPDNAKIGTVEITSPTLPGSLIGSVFLGQPKPQEQYRLFMTADGFGIHVKLLGTVHPDIRTGRVVIRFKDLPQVPFERFAIHVFASQRALMATPLHCSVYSVESHFFPWNTALADQVSTKQLSFDSGPNGSSCPGPVRPFNPRLVAGTSIPTAGAFSDFTLKLDRDDGDQFLGDLNFTMPPGFTGSLRGISYCPETAISAAANEHSGQLEVIRPSCPAASKVGTTNVIAGPGTHPFAAAGHLYMAGPFKGAPLSLVAITPALAGPYDYGTVVVRVALHIDPLTAQVRALSDTIPQIIGGIPLRIRSIRVSINRPNFTINPTNCAPLSIDSQGIGDQGTITNFSSNFHAVNCSTLGFKPKMTITQLGGRKQTKRTKDPSLQIDLRTRSGDANIRSLSVTLPKAFAIDQEHLGNICSKAELAKNHCEGRQAIGYATTKTPLLDQPLSGPAYAVSGYGKLPHLAFILAGQVTIIPEATSSSVKGGHLKTVVPVIPDAPIGHFRLTLFGGKQGYLQNTRNLCAAPAVSEVSFQGQNGKSLTQRVKTKTACGSKGKAKRPQR